MSDLVEGLVVSHLGQGIAVEVSDSILLCQTRRKLETVAVGDQVMVIQSSADQGRIEKILPRRSVLTRPSRNKKTRPVAANIDKIYVIFATEPHCDFLLIDQYLAICESKNIDAVLVLNKVDLNNLAEIETELQQYQKLGYKLHKVSAIKDIGMTELKAALNNQISIFAGQSGVGKSSLTNAIIPDKQLKTNTVSEITKHGRHTTTAATLYHLPEGGGLIDSPGVAIFGLADLTEQQLAWGYREFQPLLELCRFSDCRHLKDKGCAVRMAAENGDISKQRYQRFLKLREKMPTSH
ncbi:MAG: ribosome small subunit-dependent GTPase A [Methylococcales bacterium]|nr:ribosome small subunit-dependent GTPase A [Methylococcales bacterium]